jgi:mono/diheme cytochrome c family protein
MLRMILVIFGTAAAVVGMLGLRGQTSANRPWHIFWDMKYQPVYKAQAQSKFFSDGRSMRQPVEGTVAYTAPGYFPDAGSISEPDETVLKADDVLYRGIAGPDIEVTQMVDGKPVKAKQTNWVRNIPQKAVDAFGGYRQMFERGRDRYYVNCVVCHGESGRGGNGNDAHGIFGKYNPQGGQVANYHLPLYLSMADGEIYNTITNGKNSMSAYWHQVKVLDRWAIVAYIRALQFSQSADLSLIPAPEREKLGVK